MWQSAQTGGSRVSANFSVITVVVTTFALVASAAPADDPECTLAHLDKCGKNIFLWTLDTRTASAPSNAEELVEHCERQAASERCVRKRSAKCHSNVVKGFSRLLYDANHEEYEQRCDPSSEYHSAYLKIAPCINKVSTNMLNCTTRFIIATQSVGDHGKSLRERIPRACCSFASYLHCAETEARRICDDATANFVKEYMEKTSGELLELACGSYTAGDSVCKNFLSSEILTDEDVEKRLDAIGVKTMLGALSQLSQALQSSRG